MKNILLVAMIAVLSCAIAGPTIYAQVEEAGATSSFLRGFDVYRFSQTGFKKDTENFSSFINSTYSGETAEANFPTNKMGIGMLNAATAWTDLPRGMARVSRNDNLLMGMTLGLGEGVVSAIGRGAAGVIDMATFGLPPYEEPLVTPEYRTENPNEELKVKLLSW